MQRKTRIPFLILTLFAAFSTSALVLPKVDFVTPTIVRVRWNDGLPLRENETGCCSYNLSRVNVSERNQGTFRILASDSLEVWLDGKSGSVKFVDPVTMSVILTEKGRERTETVRERIQYDEASARVVKTANGDITVKDEVRRDTIGKMTSFRSEFLSPSEKALYGLGQHMEGDMNLLDKTVYLTQHNLKIAIPILLSPRGYGLFFDAGCAMKFSPISKGFRFDLDAAHTLDYYFIKGNTMADVVGGYRYLTGAVELLPRYAFGYIQSKERYSSSSEILSTLGEYRRRHIPIDVIVQDWNYWPSGWGGMQMDRRYYPSPRALADSVHAMNAKIMISIWPNPQWCEQANDFKSRGYMLPHDVYDVFNPDARSLYWKYADREFFSAGFDAWWCDSSEPLDGDWNQLPSPNADGSAYSWRNHERRWKLNKEILSEALGAERSNLYSLYHSRGIYENQRATDSLKRVLTLTRSAYPGQQRYATVVWNGDTPASWESFRRQIPSGLNYMSTGNPYWTTDIGAFFVRKGDSQWFRAGEFKGGKDDTAYSEFYTRMFQWATFLPILRSHGSDTPREIWHFGEPGTPFYDAVLSMIHTRYKLLPYIYSNAAKQSVSGYSMVRLLAFDYPYDKNVYDISDQYMFGDIMVCPVTRPLSETSKRRIYLPAGTDWIEWQSGKKVRGGRSIETEVTIETIPLYIRAGSIIVSSEIVEYADAQTDKPLTVAIYPGRDAIFTLYSDAGDGYEYKKGQFDTIDLLWNEQKKELSIVPKNICMVKNKEFTIILGNDVRNIHYEGKPITVSFR